MTGPGAAGCQSLSVSAVITGKTKKKKKKTSSHLVVVPHIHFRFSTGRRWWTIISDAGERVDRRRHFKFESRCGPALWVMIVPYFIIIFVLKKSDQI